jgi:hypothetical protein
MNIDNKGPLFKGFLSDFKLGVGTSKTSLNQTSVSSTEQKSVSMQLDVDGESSESYKKEKNAQKKSSKKASVSSSVKTKKDPEEAKKINMKLLNLI